MRSHTAVTILKVIAYIGFYLLLVFTVVFLIKSVINISDPEPGFTNNNLRNFSFNVRSTVAQAKMPTTINAAKTATYEQAYNRYVVNIQPDTPAGYYTLLIKTLYMVLGLWVLGLFIRILKNIGNGDTPFHSKIIRQLRWMALMFIATDCIRILDYLILGRMLRGLFPVMQFQLETEVGSGFITGLIVWVIALVYASGVRLQKEQEFTI